MKIFIKFVFHLAIVLCADIILHFGWLLMDHELVTLLL